MKPAREFSLRPLRPTPPFVFQTEAELKFITAQGGGAYEIAAWVGLTRRANSARRPVFRATTSTLASLMGCRYGKAKGLLKWLKKIGMLQIESSRDPRGSSYSLGTPCLSCSSAHEHIVPITSAQPAQATSVCGADSLQEERSKINLQERGGAAASLRVLAAHATRQLPLPPLPAVAAEIEPRADKIEAIAESLASRGIGECVRFVATRNFRGVITDTLNALIGTVPEVQLRRTCAFVYAKGSVQEPPWELAKRAEVLTARLKQAQPHEPLEESCSIKPEVLYAGAQ